MDNETFETLAEVIAFECINDPAKYALFSDIFFKRYENKAASFIHLDGAGAVTVVTRGKAENGYITAYDMNYGADSRNAYGGHYSGAPSYRIKLEIAVR